MPTTQQIPFIFPFPPALAPAMSQDPVPYISLNFLQPPSLRPHPLFPPISALQPPVLFTLCLFLLCIATPNSYSLNLFPSSLLWWVPGLTPQPPLRPSCSLSVLHSDLLIVHSKKCAEWHLCSMRCASRQEEHKSKQEGVYLLLCPGGAYDQLRG